MKRSLSVVLMAGTVLSGLAAAGAGDAIEKDRKLIAGAWRVVAMEVNGNKASDADAAKITVVNAADGTWSIRSEGLEISKGTSEFDPGKKPKTIKFMPTEGAGSGNEYLGIYELGANTRKLCFSPPGLEAPTEFASMAGSQHTLVVLEREKAEPVQKEGGLAKPLKVVQLQGGFAGFTGVQYTIAPDGAWSSDTIFNEKKTPKAKGNLSEKDVAKLAALLEKYDLAKLPEKAGREPGANPHSITFEYGKKKASLVGQEPPRLDPKNPTGSVESRFAGIWEGVIGLVEKKKDQ